MALDPLLNDLKEKLRITWTDEDDALDKLLKKSKHYIEGITGARNALAFDYSVDLTAAELVLEHSRYVYNNAGDEFQQNYHADLVRLQIQVAIKVGVTNEADTP
ncbi:phage head-tail connector protein [Jeotgalibacillus haloalkalitolerans]|uniref:Phage head-tail connector protein n=1 Tax=Jeotgalibacillus haloalkalitolerans TaxID=3104292 RepID=A0ABU5KMF1_9BACL|nr:phage head-tail connector protein [Jeotgalibacillus sp. HH7-29]MDZ5712243.1 phage head-tail connector protein [Jeotgalibacillus sp. HH7-29]